VHTEHVVVGRRNLKLKELSDQQQHHQHQQQPHLFHQTTYKNKFFLQMSPFIQKVINHWLLWFLSALIVNSAVAGNPDAKRLYDDLLSNYNKLVRPVVNTSDVLRVCIKLKLSQLIDVVSTMSFFYYHKIKVLK
jgi:hypothetical protein